MKSSVRKKNIGESAGNAELFHKVHELIRVIRQSPGSAAEALRQAANHDLEALDMELAADAPSPENVHAILAQLRKRLLGTEGAEQIEELIDQALHDFEQGAAT